jgi:diguanylate cyclase (GGDEF)-like protein
MAVEIPARAVKRLLRPGWFRSYGLLAAAALLFTGFLVLSFHKLRQQHEVELQDVGMNFWLVSQADYELQRLRHALDAYALGDPNYDREALVQRFDIFWSRLPLLIEGNDSALIQDSGAAAVVTRLIDALERIEPDLLLLTPHDEAAHRRLAGELDRMLEPLHRLVVDVESLGGIRTQEQRLRRRQLDLEHAGYLLGILASGGLLIGLLARESRRTRSLLAEATAARARIEHLAHHDPLTDLPNRLLFADRLDQALRRADRTGDLVALHCLDVDHFKAVNDRYGHVVGDRLLIAMAERIAACLRQSDTLARLGGDEFAIIQSGLDEPGAAERLAERVLAAFGEAIALDALRIATAVSIGISLYPAHAMAPAALQSFADDALYRAKSNGRSCFCLWTPEGTVGFRQLSAG